ncbi:substrate-binding domain-containing protein [Streptomyces sp. NPDC005533]|uniref:substrate-binding domain-containing protein n=1 Tax=Streptomyces sp. NPDC005533 TaxID=3364723 RepID=UPI0036CA4F41
MERLLRAHPDPDAVFAASDAMAIGALRTLRERGLRVPEDIAVIGFNDLASARHTSPPPTTGRQPVRALGQEMARMPVSAIEGHRPSPLILPTRLTTRESAPDLSAPARSAGGPGAWPPDHRHRRPGGSRRPRYVKTVAPDVNPVRHSP